MMLVSPSRTMFLLTPSIFYVLPPTLQLSTKSVDFGGSRAASFQNVIKEQTNHEACN